MGRMRRIKWSTWDVLVCSLFFIVRHSAALSGICTNETIQDTPGAWVEEISSPVAQQAHVAGVVSYWGKDRLVVFGGASERSDDVSDIAPDQSTVRLFTPSNSSSWPASPPHDPYDASGPNATDTNGTWTTLPMLSFPSTTSSSSLPDCPPPALFKAASFVHNNSLFIMGGHTAVSKDVSSEVWRADVHAFGGSKSGQWRGVDVSVGPGQGDEAQVPSGRYGHTATLLEPSSGSSATAYVLLFGGMDGGQGLVEDQAYMLSLSDSVGDLLFCNATYLSNFNSRLTYPDNETASSDCADYASVRERDTVGVWWNLTTTSSSPSARAYHTAASLPTDGQGNTSCAYLFGGWNYLTSSILGDLWRLCPRGGSAALSSSSSEDSLSIDFEWTQLSGSDSDGDGTVTPRIRYGAALLAGGGLVTANGDGGNTPVGLYHLLLWGGSGKFPYSYLDDPYLFDARLGVWTAVADSFSTPFSSSSSSSSFSSSTVVDPGPRRDHSMSVVGGLLYVLGGIDSSSLVPLNSLHSLNFSAPACGAGYAAVLCSGDISSDLIGCEECPEGGFSLEASYECDMCTSGSFQALPASSNCTLCSAGTYGLGPGFSSEESACRDCPGGSSSANEGASSSSDCVVCQAGTYSANGATECSPCPAGSSSEANSTACSSCGPGTFSVDSFCEDCPQGTFSSLGGASSCLSCPRGFFSEEGASSCQPCMNGTFSTHGAGQCTECPPGSFSDGLGRAYCTACPAGTASDQDSAASRTACLACGAGNFSLAGASACAPCPIGFYDSDNSTTTIAWDWGGPSSWWYSSNVTDLCSPCPLHHFGASSEGPSGLTSSLECVACPPGTYTESTGSSDASDCLACPPGTSSSASAGQGCASCMRGTYTDTYAAAQNESCLDCAEGSFALERGSSACESCPSSSTSTSSSSSSSSSSTTTTTSTSSSLSSIGSFAYNRHSSCVDCSYNASCPLGPNGLPCSGQGTCDLAICECAGSFNGVDCSGGSCTDGGDQDEDPTRCGGVFGFSLASHFVSGREAQAPAASSSFNLTIERFVGYDGYVEVSVDVMVGGTNATAGVDYLHETSAPATWPLVVIFEDGQQTANVSAPVIDNAVQEQGCRVVLLNITSVNGTGASVVSNMDNIRDLSSSATVAISEDDFAPRVLSSVAEDTSEGGLSLSRATVLLGANTQSPSSSLNASLLLSVTVPANMSSSVLGARSRLEVGLALELEDGQLEHWGRLRDLLPGIFAEWETDYAYPTLGVAAFLADASEIDGFEYPSTSYSYSEGGYGEYQQEYSHTFASSGGVEVVAGAASFALMDSSDSSSSWYSSTSWSSSAMSSTSSNSTTLHDATLALDAIIAAVGRGSDETAGTLVTSGGGQLNALTSLGAAQFTHSVSGQAQSLWSGSAAEEAEEAEEEGEEGESGGVWRVLLVLTGGTSFLDPFLNSTFSSSSSESLSASLALAAANISAAAAALEAQAVSPLFVLTNSSQLEAYEALVEALGFGVAVSIDESLALSSNFNSNYLAQAVREGLQLLSRQVSLHVVSDGGGVVANINPPVYHNVTPGTSVQFSVNFTSPVTALQQVEEEEVGLDTFSAGVTLQFQGFQGLLTAVTAETTCSSSGGEAEASGGAALALLDAERLGFVQGFYLDEESLWHRTSTEGRLVPIAAEGEDDDDENHVYLRGGMAGPFGVEAVVLDTRRGGAEVEASYNFTVSFDSAMPLLLKAYANVEEGEASPCSVELFLQLTDGSSETLTLQWSATDAVSGQSSWQQQHAVWYGINVVERGTIRVKGPALWAGIGLSAHPVPACSCSVGYYLNIFTGPARACEPQPLCRFFEADTCAFCPAGYACPQGGTRTRCTDTLYSMGGYTECRNCPDGWVCDKGLAEPCGYGPGTVNAVESGGHQNCTSCPAGSLCKDGIATACPLGHVSPGGASSFYCVPCEPGSFANVTGMETCLGCPLGYTSTLASSGCTACRAGQFAEEGQYPCSSCPPGSFSPAGSSSCTECLSDSFADSWGSSECLPCGEGLTAAEGATECS